MQPIQALGQLEAKRFEFGAGQGTARLALLQSLAGACLKSTRAVMRLHEQLCFMHAYPDDPKVLAQVAGMLKGFARRQDLRRHRTALADSGIAGTDIRDRFYWPTARWLAARWPEQLLIDWDAVDDPDRLLAALRLLMTPHERARLKGRNPSPRTVIGRLKHRSTGDGTFLIRRMEALPGNDFTREALADGLDTPLLIEPAATTPSRTLARHSSSPVAFIKAPLRQTRPDLHAELKRAPGSIRAAPAREAVRLIDLAHAALVTRLRDIDGIAYANVHDVWVVTDDNGLQWAFIGIVPERRQLLQATYGFVTLRNGVPIGYGQMDTLFRCSDVSFNSFDTFRGAETAWVFARLLVACRALLGTCTFTLDGYQLGHHNEEAIASGAWWFYYKLGFRPRSAPIRQLASSEVMRIQSSPGHRTSPSLLRRLAADSMIFSTGGVSAPDWTLLADCGLRAAAPQAALHEVDREAAILECSRRVARQLGLRSLTRATAASSSSREAWNRWAPLVELLGVSRWDASDRRSLASIILAKGGPSEIEFLRRFDAHTPLNKALRALVRA